MSVLRPLVFSIFLALVSHANAEDLVFSKVRLVQALKESSTEEDFRRIPITLTYPLGFKLAKRSAGAQDFLFVCSPSADIEGYLKGVGEESIGEGFFTMTGSLNVGFIPGLNKFTSENNRNADLNMEKSGIEHITSRRVDQGDLAILETVGEHSNGRHIFIAYVALPPGPSVIRFMYYHPKIYRDADMKIWSTFVKGLSSN